MAIKIKTEEEIEIMQEGGKILAKIVDELAKYANIGISTYDIDKYAEGLCVTHKVVPAFKGYMGFPASVCTGVNSTVVHGIPNEGEILINGDILSIDMGIKFKGYYLDHAVTIPIGAVRENAKKLMTVTRRSRDFGIKSAIIGNTIGDIGYAMEAEVIKGGFSIVREMVGHGIGKSLHEDPEIPGYGVLGDGQVLKKNMCLAIEAIVNEGRASINVSKSDGWTTKTRDGKLSALFEHTVVVSENGPLVLTQV